MDVSEVSLVQMLVMAVVRKWDELCPLLTRHCRSFQALQVMNTDFRIRFQIRTGTSALQICTFIPGHFKQIRLCYDVYFTIGYDRLIGPDRHRCPLNPSFIFVSRTVSP
jgi:hypothetical protein